MFDSKKLIVVLGSHRSGTSVCAAALETLGADLRLPAHYKNEENLIPAMVVGFKSSKAMDAEDGLSENQDGMNLVLTSSGGFLRTLAYSLTDDIAKINQWSYTL